jgi:hypothetical protein
LLRASCGTRDAQLEITDLVCRFIAERLEHEPAAHADLLRGLEWGRGRFGHPEGRVGLHVASARIGRLPVDA